MSGTLDSDEWAVVPEDYANPDWDAARKVHDWRNHVGMHVKPIWDTFTDYQKRAIAAYAQDHADAEEWD